MKCGTTDQHFLKTQGFSPAEKVQGGTRNVGSKTHLEKSRRVDYVDQHGKRHIRTFERKKEADAYHANVRIDVSRGTHTPDSASITVADAAELWLTTCDNHGLERATTSAYRQHVRLHINPYLGRMNLAQLSAPVIREFEDKLRTGTPEGKARSTAMIKKIRSSLGSLIADAHERGLVSRNVVRELRSSRKRGKERRAERRQKGKLKVGVHIPSPEEIKALVDALQGRCRPLLLTAIFTGLRASELRGLRWDDVDLTKRELHVRQRADRYNVIGKPKSEAGERSVPLTSRVANALREWKLACPRTEDGLVFPTKNGTVEYLPNIIKRGLWPAMIAAGVTVPARDGEGKPLVGKDGRPILRAKYTGLHALRHFYASWCINRSEDAGLGLPPKVVQERLGHSTITMTLDVYGHLFPRGEDHADQMDAAERRLLA
jgi:integrase